ncbi:putative phage tail protein [Butyricicoccus sp. AM78-15b2TA]|jgi:hypothetical protein|uniref:putative phage tail protein n=1 Tax=Butyricicoccus sp. AM78-15b2TA TaxID=3002516 RepID=UPI0022E54E17|nr:putative phage tail protein [Butyricicoccus sp. AM78-15b2TA]
MYEDMLISLPTAYRKDRWVRDLLEAIRGLDESQRTEMLDAAAQLFPASMTWLLETEERAVNLPSTGTLEERRTALIARWRGAGKCDVERIQSVCDSWRNGEISVGFAKGVIVLTFVGAYGMPDNTALAALRDAIEQTVPCHLAVKYLWRWLLVREVSAMTVDELQRHRISDFAF